VLLWKINSCYWWFTLIVSLASIVHSDGKGNRTALYWPVSCEGKVLVRLLKVGLGIAGFLGLQSASRWRLVMVVSTVKLQLTSLAVWSYSKIDYQRKFQDGERCKIKPWNGLLKMRNRDIHVTWWKWTLGDLDVRAQQNRVKKYHYNDVMMRNMMKPQTMDILKLHVLLQIMKEIYACILCCVMEINVTFWSWRRRHGTVTTLQEKGWIWTVSGKSRLMFRSCHYTWRHSMYQFSWV